MDVYSPNRFRDIIEKAYKLKDFDNLTITKYHEDEDVSIYYETVDENSHFEFIKEVSNGTLDNDLISYIVRNRFNQRYPIDDGLLMKSLPMYFMTKTGRYDAFVEIYHNHKCDKLTITRIKYYPRESDHDENWWNAFHQKFDNKEGSLIC